jgi:hypothetical protein
MSARRILSAFIIALAATPAAAQGVDFAPLLDGLESCRFNDAHDAFWRSLGERYGNNFGEKGARDDKSVKIKIPDALKAGIGAARSANKGEYTDVVAPLSGVYKGLPLRSIEYSFGNENGIWVATLNFAAPRADVARVFGKTVAEANRAGARAMKSDDGVGYSVEIPKGAQGAVTCNRSN